MRHLPALAALIGSIILVGNLNLPALLSTGGGIPA